MKAITCQRYGGPEVLEFEEVDDPVVGDDEVLVGVRAVSANPRDWHLMRGLPYFVRLQFGLRRPRHAVLGGDVAGRVEAVGKAVTRFRPGDEVLADIETGGFAEYAAVRQDLLEPKPASLGFEQAAAVPLAALTALQGLRDHGRVQPGQQVLVIGAAGGVGTFAVQLAKLSGGGGDRRVQHREAGPGPLARRRPRHRLHPGGLHPERPAVRPRPPAGRDQLAGRLPAGPHRQRERSC